jgi:hypothetical protein
MCRACVLVVGSAQQMMCQLVLMLSVYCLLLFSIYNGANSYFNTLHGCYTLIGEYTRCHFMHFYGVFVRDLHL